MRRPVEKFTRISSRHGEKGTGVFKKHIGTDYVCPVGTPVLAPVSGVIRTISYGPSGGKQIEMEGEGKYWRFLHLSRQDVRPGQDVREGQIIGLSGNTGITTGPHLHCDVRKPSVWNASFNNYYDPEYLIAEANKPKPVATTATSTKDPKYIHLKKHVTKWAFYRPGTPLPLKRASRAGELSPQKWGGLTYPFVRWVAPNTAEVKSPSLGLIWLYLDGDSELRDRV